MITFHKSVFAYHRGVKILFMLKLLFYEKCMVFSLILCWLTAGCGGGGAHSSTDEITATISTTEPEIDYIFGRVQNFEGARATAYAIDVNSGALSLIDPDEALYRFLSKQPDIAVSDILMPNGEQSYSALTHLYHDVGTAPQSSHDINSFHQSDPGHFFLWGSQGRAPSTPLDYTLETLWYCGDCDISFGQDKAYLFIKDDQAHLSLTTDERQLIFPLSINETGLIHNDHSPSFIARTDNQQIPLSQWQAQGAFFGPTAEEAGLIFSLFYNQSVFSAAGIGAQTQ